MHLLTVALALVAAQEPAPIALPAPEVTPNRETLGAWKEHLQTKPAEERWREIPWIASFAGGLREAGEQQRPLLFWAMNGHPLGCT